MINRTILFTMIIVLICYIVYDNYNIETFTVNSAYNRSMRYIRYNAPSGVTSFVKTIMNTVQRYIPGI